MATIDYKEKYEQALERARQFSEKPYLKDSAGIVEYIFPELKESDDERIRKAIHIYLDWLDGKKDVAPIGEYSIRDMIAWVKKQGEQKPAEWTAEDEEELKIALNTLEKAGQYSSAKWLKNVCLVPQTMQKPAWSEEDEKLVKNLISTLSNLYARNLIEKETKEKYTNLLKSLRPQNRCKPSDEQMDALKHAFNDGSIAFADMKILATLYEQLKALHRYEQDT